VAQIRLDREEVGKEQLPGACMRCGQPAVVYKSKNFAWHPPWVAVLILAGLLPYAIVAIVLTKRMTVYAPFCEAHKNHWLVRILGALGGLLLVGALGIGMIVLMANTDDPAGRRDNVLQSIKAVGCIGTLVLLVVWLIGLVVMQMTAIRPTEITDDTITLTGVSETFIDAVDADRAQWEEEYERRRPRRRRRPERSEGVYDQEDRRRPRRPPDAYEDEDV
jgi:hypothetical protein